MDSDYQKLASLFISDPDNAIKESQKIICSVTNFDSYQDFYNYHQKNAHISTCPNEWTSSQLCIYCRDCAAINPACICLPCFLNGNHEGHNYVILCCGGNCDCGDLSQWKISGCCKKHQGLAEDANPEDYLDEKLRTTLVDVIFKAAFSSLKNFTTTNSEKASTIIQFVSSFLKLGDGFRRLIAQSITEKIDFEDILTHLPQYSTLFNQSLQQLCGGLVNDKLFIRNFSQIGFKAISNGIIKDTSNYLRSGPRSISYHSWDNFWFHIFGEKSLQYNINNKNWDWVSFFTECLPYFKDLFDFVEDDSYEQITSLLTVLSVYIPIATMFQPNEQTQLCLDNIVTKILSCGSLKSVSKGATKNNTIITTSFDRPSQRGDYFSVFHFIQFFYSVYNAFINKPNLKFDTFIEQLDKTFDISSIYMISKNTIDNVIENENDKFISSLINQPKNDTEYPLHYYRSFHNGGSFFLSHPLFQSLVTIFRNDNITRIKIAKLLSLEKYQSLRIRLGIATLKTILSNICYHQNLVSGANSGAEIIYDIFNKPDNCSKYFPKFYPLFQLIIGLQCEKEDLNNEFSLKEFFAFESAREIGLFDDLTKEEYEDENIEEKHKQMIFSFLYVSLLFVIERTLFNYNGNDFIKEQLIFNLTNKVHSIDELDKLYDNGAIDSWAHLWIFNYLLMKVATTNKNNESENQESNHQNDVSFYLKEDVEWNPISAINSLNKQMTLMNEKISKNSEKLFKIQNFIDEEKYFFHPRKMCKDEVLDSNYKEEDELTDVPIIHLNEYLMTPTVLAVVYTTLRTTNKEIDLNDHLAMNILVLISKFSNINNNSSQKVFTEIHYDSLNDLICKLKKSVFNESNNFVIENFVKENFVSLLKLKLTSNKDGQSKSFIDILVEKGKIGQNVIDEISQNVHFNLLDDSNKEQNQKQSTKNVKELNRQRAKKLKEEIMNHYKGIITNYNVSDHLQQKGADSIDEISNTSNSVTFSSDNEVCSICSTHKKDQIFTYPLYIYRTKFPFIIDKPPKFTNESDQIAVDDNCEDFDQVPKKSATRTHNKKDENDEEEEEEEEENDDDELPVSTDDVMSLLMNTFPQLTETEGLSPEEIAERQNTLTAIFGTLMEQQIHRAQEVKRQKSFNNKKKGMVENENKQHNEMKLNKDFKRCTAGANFVLQFGICQHPVHSNCVQTRKFTCPIDRSIKNGFLPSLDGIPMSIIFKDTNSFEPKMDQKEGTIAYNVINTILSFICNCASFFDCINLPYLDIYVELVKSISGLISTYEIRLRNLPDCLDSERTKLLARNLFLTVWCGYRIQKKPKMVLRKSEDEKVDVECEPKLTTFQRFIKKLIECDKIETEFSQIVNFFIDEIKKKGDQIDLELCLFLRRVCLASYFLLNKDVHSATGNNDIIDWDDVLSPSSLSERFKVNFGSIDDGFEFKPFSFLNLPKQFLRFGAKPFEFHIEKVEQLMFFNLIDYNYLIDRYDEINGEILSGDEDVELKKNSMNLNTCDSSMLRFFLRSFYSKRHYPSVLLYVGKFASEVILIDQSHISFLNPFYLDKYGCPDIGYKRSQPLYLNEERYEKLIDTILSGDFSYSLHEIARDD